MYWNIYKQAGTLYPSTPPPPPLPAQNSLYIIVASFWFHTQTTALTFTPIKTPNVQTSTNTGMAADWWSVQWLSWHFSGQKVAKVIHRNQSITVYNRSNKGSSVLLRALLATTLLPSLSTTHTHYTHTLHTLHTHTHTTHTHTHTHTDTTHRHTLTLTLHTNTHTHTHTLFLSAFWGGVSMSASLLILFPIYADLNW